jgi:PAS domain-containing protein
VLLEVDTIRKVTATQVVRDLRGVRDMLDNGAVAVTSHGRTEMIVISESDFSRLQLLSGTDADRLNSKLQMVMDTIDSLILILDNDMRIRRANRAYREYFGLEGVDLVGESILDRNRTATDRFITHKAEGVLASGTIRYAIRPPARSPVQLHHQALAAGRGHIRHRCNGAR